METFWLNDKSSQKIEDKIKKIIKMSDNELSESIKKIFRYYCFFSNNKNLKKFLKKN